MNKGAWKKRRKIIKGWWKYSHWMGKFYIQLEDPDPVTGRTRSFEVSGEDPNFNGWKLVREKVK